MPESYHATPGVSTASFPKSTSDTERQDAQDSTKQLRTFNTLSAIGNGYGTTNTTVGILLILSTTLPVGGSPLLFWGFMVVAFVGLCTAVTLAELCSAMPHHIWVSRLAPDGFRRCLSYFTAMLSWLAAIIMSASANLAVILGLAALVELVEPSFVYEQWKGSIGFQILHLMTLFGVCFKHAQPEISKYILLLNCSTVIVIFITLFAMSRGRVTAAAFFSGTVNQSGWPDGIAWIFGLNGLNWCFSCLNTVTHLAEEIPSPTTNLPKALMWTLVVGFCSGMFVIVANLANLPSFDGAGDASAVAIFYRITGSKAAAVGL